MSKLALFIGLAFVIVATVQTGSLVRGLIAGLIAWCIVRVLGARFNSARLETPRGASKGR